MKNEEEQVPLEYRVYGYGIETNLSSFGRFYFSRRFNQYFVLRKKSNHGILHGWQNISISERDRKTREEKHVKLGENCKISWCLTEMCTSLKKNDLSF